ncbi:MAG TPA: hypothetical protein VHM00_14485 [Caldimonas sp.]|jgi:hypothetical protein|nr:hypothetical protein [Caldimonas sp.]HEX2542277.1 hypothetical protein [Caldimonas sp.]
MRNSLACHVSLRQFGVWRLGVAVLAALSLASLGVWVVSGREQWTAAAMAGAAVAAVVAVMLAASLARVQSGTLRLEEGRWTFAPTLPSGVEPRPGRIDVALDLGSFMLLCFRPLGASGELGRRQWLPAQRQGHEADWHALRCAAYSPSSADVEFRSRVPSPPE